MAGTQELPPIHPNRVMARAILTGLSTTVELMRIIKTEATQYLYELSKEKLEKAKKAYDDGKKTGTPDFSIIIKVEPSIRENFLAMLSEKASRFGNVEVVRVYDPRDTIRRLNQGYNRAGGVLRNFNACWYDFPNSEQFGIRKGKDGRKIRITGYTGPSTGNVQTKHCDNPSLDFGDVNRWERRGRKEEERERKRKERKERKKSSKQKSSLSSKGRVSDLGESAAVHHVQMDLLGFGDKLEMGDNDPAVAKDAETHSVTGSDTTRTRQEKEARTVGGIPSR